MTGIADSDVRVPVDLGARCLRRDLNAPVPFNACDPLLSSLTAACSDIGTAVSLLHGLESEVGESACRLLRLAGVEGAVCIAGPPGSPPGTRVAWADAAISLL